MVLDNIGYIGGFEYVDDHRAGKIMVELNGRLNKCGVISPHFDVGVKEIEGWIVRLLPSRQARKPGDLGVGAFFENGPFRPNGEFLIKNEYSWNKGALFLHIPFYLPEWPAFILLLIELLCCVLHVIFGDTNWSGDLLC
ncbi:Ribosomal protein S8 superfamily [Sesbania bispinosa]|nr:Ribosomal protein S8 superfamily [Sesbania bispinosa]